MNPDQIITRLQSWYDKTHPLHLVLFEQKLAANEVAEIRPVPDTLRDTWHMPVAIIPWPRLIDQVRAELGHLGQCLLERVTIRDLDQVPVGPNIVTLIHPNDAGIKFPVQFGAFDRANPPVLRVRALEGTKFVLAMMCDLYEVVSP